MLSFIIFIHIIVGFMKKYISRLLMITTCTAVISGCASDSMIDRFNKQYEAPPPSQESIAMNDAFWQGNPNIIWNKLQTIPPSKLETMETTSPNQAGWIKLAIISKRDNKNPTQLSQSLTTWRTEYPNHPGNALFPDSATLPQLSTPHLPQHIAIMLPLAGPLGSQGKTVRDGILRAYYINLAKTHITQSISFYDTSQNKDTTSLYQKAVAEGADFVIGPLTKDDVQTLMRQNHFPVTTLALNYTDDTSGELPGNFYQFGLSPHDETQQIADKAKEAGLSHAIIIATQDDRGRRIAKSLTSRWQADGGKIQDSLYISPAMNLSETIASLLHVNVASDKRKPPTAKDHRQDVDVIFLITPPQTARATVPLIKYYYAASIPIYATSTIYSGTAAPEKDSDLDDVVFCDTPWTVKGNHPNRLYAVGLDAYKLSTELDRLKSLPGFPLYGATGALTLNSDHKITRRLPWTTMHDGHP